MQRGQQLASYLAGQRVGAFGWGGANCAHFISSWWALLTGRDPMAGLPATPNARAALRLVRCLGGDLKAACTKQLGVEPIDAALAQIGDIVMADMPGAVGALGICAGRNAVFRAATGVAEIPMSHAVCAWRVPSC